MKEKQRMKKGNKGVGRKERKELEEKYKEEGRRKERVGRKV